MNHGSFKQFVSNLRFQFHRETGECTILRANLNQVRGKCLIDKIKVWLRSGNACIEKKRFNNLFYLINYFLSRIRCSFHRNFNNRDIVSFRMRKRKMLKLLKLFSSRSSTFGNDDFIFLFVRISMSYRDIFAV